MEHKRISMDDAKVGEALPWDIYAVNGALLLRRGFVIQSLQQLERLVSQGMYVDAKALEQERSNVAVAEAPEVPSVVKMIEGARHLLEQVANDLSQGSPNLVKRIRQAVVLIKAACNQNRDIALATVILKQEGRYSLTHSVHSAIITRIVGANLDRADEELDAAVAAALTMNLGMLQLQDELQSQSKPLTAEQKLEMMRHPVISLDLLQNAGVTDELWLSTVLQHHEQSDGSGYPLKKRGGEILDIAKLVQLADLYTARVAKRSYRASVHPSVALRDIFLDRGKLIDAGLAAHFIKDIGVYPPGTLVKLNNGEIAIVSHQTSKSNMPVVHALFGPFGAPLPNPIKRDTSINQFAIHEIVDPTKINLRLDLQVVWGKEAAS